MNTRQLALLSLFTALCIGLQLAPRPPNVEFTSFITFTVGVVFGLWAGIIVGGMTMFINGFLSPWGYAGLNLPFQMVGIAFAGIFGGTYRMFALKESNSARFCQETAVLGALIALIYDFITNVGVGVQFSLAGMDPTLALLSAIAYGSFFSLVHILSNSAVFGFLFLPLANSLQKFQIGGGDLSWSRKERLYS